MCWDRVTIQVAQAPLGVGCRGERSYVPLSPLCLLSFQARPTCPTRTGRTVADFTIRRCVVSAVLAVLSGQPNFPDTHWPNCLRHYNSSLRCLDPLDTKSFRHKSTDLLSLKALSAIGTLISSFADRLVQSNGKTTRIRPSFHFHEESKPIASESRNQTKVELRKNPYVCRYSDEEKGPGVDRGMNRQLNVR